MKKAFFALILAPLVSVFGFSFEFSPFVSQIIAAGPCQMAEIIENTSSGTFSREMVRLLNSLSSWDFRYCPREGPPASPSIKQMTAYFFRANPGGGEAWWMWDKIWHVLMIGSGLIFDQAVKDYEGDVRRLLELACRPLDSRNSRYENDLIGFARLTVQSLPGGQRFPPPGVPPPAPRAESGGTCRIQVGSFRGFGSAQEAATRLRQAGFSPAYEISGDYCRVVIPGVSASEARIAAQLLQAAGFKEVWIREEG